MDQTHFSLLLPQEQLKTLDIIDMTNIKRLKSGEKKTDWLSGELLGYSFYSIYYRLHAEEAGI